MKNSKKSSSILFIIIINILLSSCNFTPKKQNLGYELKINKDLRVNQLVKSTFKYSSDLDTIKLGKSDFRYIHMYLGVFKENITIQELKKRQTELDTFLSFTNDINTIPFYIKIKEKGDHYVAGYIKDYVFLGQPQIKDTARIITHENRVVGKVKVLE